MRLNLLTLKKISFLLLFAVLLPVSGRAITVTSADDLATFLNSCVPSGSGQVTYSNGIVDINTSVPFTATEDIVIPENVNITLLHKGYLNASIIINGGSLYIKSGSYPSHTAKLNVTLNSGNFKIEPNDSPRMSNVTINGGTLEEIDPDPLYPLPGQGPTIENINITGGCLIKGLKSNNKSGPTLCKTMVISSTANDVIIQDVGISERLETSGNGTLKTIDCPQIQVNEGKMNLSTVNSTQHPSITDLTITLKGGETSMYDVWASVIVENGNLTVNGTPRINQGKEDIVDEAVTPAIHLNGDGAKVTCLEGVYNTLQLTKGVLDIQGGSFNGINVEGGELSMSKGVFLAPLIIAAPAQVKLGEVYFSYNEDASLGMYQKSISPTIFIYNTSNVKPEDLLAQGYSFYTHPANIIQPDLLVEGKDIPTKQITRNSVEGIGVFIGAVKQTNKPSGANSWYEAASLADVGPEGKDITIEGNRYLIKTPAGLAWVANSLNCMWNADYNGYEYYGFGKNGQYPLPKIYQNEDSKKDVICFALANDLDMSMYNGQKVDWNWCPFYLIDHYFDGQGHTISNLKVEQHSPCFIIEIRDPIVSNPALSNLNIQGTVKIVANEYIEDSKLASGAGLALDNEGTIINCSFSGSIISNSYLEYHIGGLVYDNSGKIMNCYMAGDINAVKTAVGISFSYNRTPLDAGGLVCFNSGLISNCFHTGDVSCINETNENFEINTGEFIARDFGGSTENCHGGDIPISTLNDNVDIYNKNCSDPTRLWNYWVDGENNHPILGTEKGPSIIETQIALLVKGDGELEATYSIKNDDPSKDPIEKTIKANTTVNIRNLVEFKITAKPGKGAELVKVTRTLGNQPETELEGIVANEPFKYDVSFLSATITAYFHTVTLYVDADTPLIGGAEGEIEEVEHVNISGVGTSDNPVEKELGNVKVTAKEGEGTTTIDGHSHVILNLSGTSSLGKLRNQGTAVFRKKTAEATLVVKEVVNEGILIDETGLITEVKGDTGNTLLSLNGSQGDQVEVGEKATLRAKATVPAGATVRFQWQLWNGTEWKDVEGGSTTYPKVETRSGSLRASATDTDTHEDRYETGVLTEGNTLQYRCLIITSVNDGSSDPSVSTTLTTYAEVKVTQKSDPGTDTDPDPDPTPSYTYYEVTLPEVTGATMNPAAGKHIVKEGAPFSFTLTLDADYNQSKPEVKAGNEVLVADVNGKYTIENVRENLAITITGITLNNPTANAEVKQSVKVWSKGDVLYLYSSRPTMAHVAGINGQLWKSFSFSGSVEVSGLPHGSYIVRIGHDIFKIIH